MMIEAFILLAAAAAAPQAATAPAGHAQGAGAAASETAPAAGSAILEMTYDAFVAVEESPGLAEIARPAIFIRTGKQRAIIGASAAIPIS